MNYWVVPSYPFTIRPIIGQPVNVNNENVLAYVCFFTRKDGTSYEVAPKRIEKMNVFASFEDAELDHEKKMRQFYARALKERQQTNTIIKNFNPDKARRT